MTEIKKVREGFSKAMKSQSIGEFFGNVSWEAVEVFAMIAAGAFILSPIIQVLMNVYNYAVHITEYPYLYTIQTISRITGCFGVLTIILFIGKTAMAKTRLRETASENKAMIFFLILILLMIVSTCVNGFTQKALHGDGYRNESLFNYISYFAVYFFCASIIENRKYKKILIYAFLFGSAVIGLIALKHLYISPVEQFIHNADQTDLTAIFTNRNHYGYYLAMAIPLSSMMFIFEDNKALRAFCFLNFILNAVIIAVNDTTGAYLACLIALIFGIIVLRICNKRINRLSVMMLVIYLAIMAVMSLWYENIFTSITAMFTDIDLMLSDGENKDSAGGIRLMLWRITAESIAEKPLFGHGVEGIAQRLYDATENDRSHNEYLQYTAFFGIPAGIVYILGIISVYINALKNKTKLNGMHIAALTAAFSYFASAFFGNTMFYTAPFVFIFLGLGFFRPRRSASHK